MTLKFWRGNGQALLETLLLGRRTRRRIHLFGQGGVQGVGVLQLGVGQALQLPGQHLGGGEGGEDNFRKEAGEASGRRGRRLPPEVPGDRRGFTLSWQPMEEDISTLLDPRQQSKIRMTWVDTGRPWVAT